MISNGSLDHICTLLKEKIILITDHPNELSFSKNAEFLKKIYGFLEENSPDSKMIEGYTKANFLIEQLCAKILSSQKNLSQNQTFSQLLAKMERLQKYELNIQHKLAKGLAINVDRMELLLNCPRTQNSLALFYEKALTFQTRKILTDFEQRWTYWKIEADKDKNRSHKKTVYIFPLGLLFNKQSGLPKKIIQLIKKSDGLYLSNTKQSKNYKKKLNKKIMSFIKTKEEKKVYEENLRIKKNLHVLREYNYYPRHRAQILTNETFKQILPKKIKIRKILSSKKNLEIEARHHILYGSILKSFHLFPSKFLRHEEFEFIAFQNFRIGNLNKVNKAKKWLITSSKEDEDLDIKESKQITKKIVKILKHKNKIFCALNFSHLLKGGVLKSLGDKGFKITKKQVS